MKHSKGAINLQQRNKQKYINNTTVLNKNNDFYIYRDFENEEL